MADMEGGSLLPQSPTPKLYPDRRTVYSAHGDGLHHFVTDQTAPAPATLTKMPLNAMSTKPASRANPARAGPTLEKGVSAISPPPRNQNLERGKMGGIHTLAIAETLHTDLRIPISSPRLYEETNSVAMQCMM